MSIIIFIEIVCFIIALVCLRKDESWAWRILIVFLLITCLTEMEGKSLKDHHHSNIWLYNIFLLFEASATSLLFGKILSKYFNSKPLVLSGLALLAILYVYDIVRHGIFIFNDLTATVMSVIFVLYSFYYYFLLIKADQYVDLKRSAAFWWVAGALFFYFGSTAANVFYSFLSDIKIDGRNITYYVFTTLSIFLYSCWGYSFICRKWLTTT